MFGEQFFKVGLALEPNLKKVGVMTRVLLVGYDPKTADYSNPALPPGMSAEKVRAGVSLALREMTDRGWDGDVCYIRPDGIAGQTVEHHLASGNYACVVIGAGVRLPPQSLAVFEAVVNAVHKVAPAAVIAFNTRPEDSADAAACDGCLPADEARRIAANIAKLATTPNVTPVSFDVRFQG